MYFLSLSLSLAFICCTVSVQAKIRCYRDSQCDGGAKKCCKGTGTCITYPTYYHQGCWCKDDSFCDYWYEDCVGHSCRKRPLFTVKPSTSTSRPWKRFTSQRFTHSPKNYYCVWDSDCRGSSTCQDGNCVQKEAKGNSFEENHYDIAVLVSVSVFASLLAGGARIAWLQRAARRAERATGRAAEARRAEIARIMEARRVERAEVARRAELARRAERAGGIASSRHQQAEQVRRELSTLDENTPPSTGDAPSGSEVNEQEEQSESSATNTTVIEVEDNTPLSPDAPPPYNSMEFESRQNGNDDLPEEPPPSYDEAIRNSGIAV